MSFKYLRNYGRNLPGAQGSLRTASVGPYLHSGSGVFVFGRETTYIHVQSMIVTATTKSMTLRLMI